MILPFLLALLAFVALLPVVAPLLRGSRPAPSRGSFDQAVYRDQLQELDRDIVRGLITPAEADAARLEIQRRLLAADRIAVAPPRLARSPLLAGVVFVVISIGSVSGYLWLGAPGVPDEPFSGRRDTASGNGQRSLQQATAGLAAKLKQNPSDAAGWVLYGRSLSMQNEWDQAEDAYRHAIALGQNSPEVVGEHAELMVMQAGGTVTPAAEAAFRKLLEVDPGSGIARYYLAIAAMQAGEPRRAIDGFQALLALLPADSPMRAPLGGKVAEAARAAGIAVPELAKGKLPEQETPEQETPVQEAPAQAAGPDAKAVADAASMSPEQREAMVRGMVANLAAKQQADPGNLEGWLRLGRAYAVLHEPDQAAEAYDKAASLKPDDVSIRLQEVRALLSDHSAAAKVPPIVVGLLKRIEASDPEQPLVLWYLGLDAAQGAHLDEARGYWKRLLKKVPADGEDAKMLQAALDGLDKR